MSTTLTSVSKRLLERLPSPIAIHWGLVHRAESDSERMRQSWAVLDSFLRYTSGIVLAGYLRGDQNDTVEAILPKFQRPALGHYCELIREGLRPLKDQPDHFLFHLYEWYYTEKGKPSEEAKRLDTLISRRNLDTHGVVRTENELEDTAKSLIFELQSLLHRARWLTGYKLFQVSNLQPQRRGGQRGSILFYMGEITNPLPKVSRWSCTLFEESVYLSHPSGATFLELNPFILVEIIGRQQALYLWVSTPKGKRIDLRCAETSEYARKLPILFEEEVAWFEWLDRRAELDPLYQNSHTSEFVTEDFQEIGMLIGKRYRVRERLGHGGMGVVYRVQDELLDKEVALKVLHLEQVDGSERERTLQEYRFMKSLTHPNILPVKNLQFLEDERIAISMPVMNGTLKDIIGSPTILTEQVEIWATEILSVLDFLHHQDNPIFHRDIKPSNILLDDQGQSYLSDFGIARQDGDVRITRTADNVGSQPYMAPELFIGDDANASTDRFALGVSLHEILTGKLPHKNQIGQGIDGDFGQFVRTLGDEDPKIRLQATWPPPVIEPPAPDSASSETDTSVEVQEQPTVSETQEFVQGKSVTQVAEEQPLKNEHTGFETEKRVEEESIQKNTAPPESLASLQEAQELAEDGLISKEELKVIEEAILNAIEHTPSSTNTSGTTTSETSTTEPPITENENQVSKPSLSTNQGITPTTEATQTETASTQTPTNPPVSKGKLALFSGLGILTLIGLILVMPNNDNHQTPPVQDKITNVTPKPRTNISTKTVPDNNDGTESLQEKVAQVAREEVQKQLQSAISNLQATLDVLNLCEKAIQSDHLLTTDQLIQHGQTLITEGNLDTLTDFLTKVAQNQNHLNDLRVACEKKPEIVTYTATEYLTMGKCLECHSIDGAKSNGGTFKGLYGSKRKDVFMGPKYTIGPKYITQAILKHQHPTNVHTTLGNTQEEQDIAIETIISYFKTLH